MSENRKVDLGLFCATMLLLVVGIFMVYDASYAVAGQMNKNPAFFRNRQAISAFIGLAMMFSAMKFPYWRLKKYSTILLVISIVGLLLVFAPHIGKAANGKTRWIAFGPVQIQPSEFAKLCLVTYIAAFFSARNINIRDWKTGLMPLALPIGVVGILIVKEDMGTAIVLMVTALGMVYAAGARTSHVLSIISGAAVVGVGFVLAESYRCHRIMAFLDPFKDYHGIGYQICQSLIALGSGGVFGMGICEGRQKLFYLPAGHTDFIYAVFGQETGLIGSSLLALAFLFFAYRGFVIARKTRDPFGRFLAVGLSTLIGAQAVLHMLVDTAFVPATGVPLPFISYGGSSLALNLLSVGVLLSISKYPKSSETYEHESSGNRRRYRRTRVSRA